MKYFMMLLVIWMLSFSYDSAIKINTHKRAESAAKAVGISPLWMYNRDTYEIQMATAETQEVIERKDHLNAELLKLCNDLQRKHNNGGREIIECVSGGQQ